MFKSKTKLIALKRITPGKRHAWYETSLGFLVRKPIGQKLSFSFKSDKKYADYQQQVFNANEFWTKENRKNRRILLKKWFSIAIGFIIGLIILKIIGII